MEIILNIAWALCSLGLIWGWTRGNASNPVPRRTQMLALAMVVLLLLPVISLSDDLMAMQGPAESDTCLRRALHTEDTHPSTPTSFALPEAIVTGLTVVRLSHEVLQEYAVAPPSTFLMRSLDSRPPPQS
jgi:hypothetical protein